MKQKITNPLYEIFHYDGSTISIKTVTLEEIMALDRESVDYFHAVDLGIIAFRNLDSEWVEIKLYENPLGTICLKILEAVMCEPGVFQTPDEIAQVTNIYSLRNPNNLSARWRALRLAHQETFKNPNFFLSKRSGGMGVAWNPEKSFIQIIRAGKSNNK